MCRECFEVAVDQWNSVFNPCVCRCSHLSTLVNDISVVVDDDITICDCIWICIVIHKSALICRIYMDRAFLSTAICTVIPCTDCHLDLRTVIIIFSDSKIIVIDDVDLVCLILAVQLQR